MELVDTHCHIQLIDDNTSDHTSALWQKDKNLSLQKVLESAKENGVNKMIVVGCTLRDSKLALELADSRPDIYASIGIHPHEAEDFLRNKSENYKNFENLILTGNITAIGECGLDYYYHHSNKSDQKTVLNFQLELATKYSLPVIFHVREGFEDFWKIVKNYPSIRGVLHSYTDSLDNLKIAQSLGFFIGINGIATFTKDETQLSMFKSVPLTNMLLETDSPYLTPIPLRGTINQPRNVRIITKFVANLLNIREEEVATQTTLNATSLFNL